MILTRFATLTTLFLLSLSATLLIVPIIRRISVRLGWVDTPSERKVHTAAMPRLGGIGIFLGVYAAVLFFWVFPNNVVDWFYEEPALCWVIAGSTVVFLMGVWDDFRRLHPLFKLGVQVAAATLVYYGGVRIAQVVTPWGTVVSLGAVSLPVTIFWFVLVINAINLIDGLDGLAAGVSLFTTLALIVICFLDGKFAVAFGLAALAGACLGFLRYNFNPASIFMGDGGSYFIGFMLAALSILGAMERQATVAMLIPIIALGVPLMDTLLAPLRRFIIGKGLFQPDRSHIHHRLMKIGFSHRKAVLVMYGATVCMGILALLGVHATDQHGGAFLLIIGLMVFVAVRKLGYLEYLAADKVIGYFRDVTDEIGLQRNRRTFLGRQKAILESCTVEDMWQGIIDALTSLDIDFAEIFLIGNSHQIPAPVRHTWLRPDDSTGLACGEGDSILSLCLPLVNHKYHGTLTIKKDMFRSPLGQHTLRRIEQLRRTIVERLCRFAAAEDVQVRGPATAIVLKGRFVKNVSETKPVFVDEGWRDAV